MSAPAVDPTTGLLIDPTTGLLIDPVTGLPMDPAATPTDDTTTPVDTSAPVDPTVTFDPTVQRNLTDAAVDNTMDEKLSAFMEENDLTEEELYDLLTARLNVVEVKPLEAWQIVLIVLGVIIIIFIGMLWVRSRSKKIKEEAILEGMDMRAPMLPPPMRMSPSMRMPPSSFRVMPRPGSFESE
jgi:hypothetical protein